MSPSPAKLRLGTRGSKLALAQANNVKATLEQRHNGLSVEIVPITTSGDKGNRDVLGSFVREIQHALLEDRVDFALHCLKDLPTDPVPGLDLAAYLEREDPRDTLIGKVSSLSALPMGAHVGTGSVRRTSQIAAARPDLTFSPLVGNIDTRLRKLSEGQYDAIILAVAGLRRLGLLASWRQDHPDLTVTPLEFDEMLPAPGQAVLVLETREADEFARSMVGVLEHPTTRTCALAERQFLGCFGGGCSVPVAAFATEHHGAVHLSGLVASPDGSKVLRGTATADEPSEAARTLFEELREQGALSLFVRAPVAAGSGQ
ncbi:MAG TPA: hydroxymethylbilane synthase [Fimbriimonadaceae bacterium]|nr:hydroxymethylbilane synthase [Fimbriimonadaceae bacterium]